MKNDVVSKRLADALAETARAVDAILERELPVPDGPDARLYEAMRYATLGSGKRMRAFLLRSSGRLAGADDRSAVLAATAVEMIHSYSLIHDDLPAMDDDDLRRGKPSCHRAFDEATAILAGDALLTEAFRLAVEPRIHPDPKVRCEFVLAMAKAAGGPGMVGGQMIDISVDRGGADRDLLTTLASRKTGALIAFSCVAGAILAESDDSVRAMLHAYGLDVGLAFQVVDDLLDVTGNAETLGKTAGKDVAADKATFATLLGADEAARTARSLVDRAISRLDDHGSQADDLRDFAELVFSRQQ